MSPMSLIAPPKGGAVLFNFHRRVIQILVRELVEVGWFYEELQGVHPSTLLTQYEAEVFRCDDVLSGLIGTH